MELEFTEAVDPSAAAAANFEVKSWHYVPTADYGGPATESATLAVRSATPDASGKRITLEINGLAVNKVVSIRIKAMTSKTGSALWNNQAWYTLNQFGPGEVVKVRPGANADKTGKAAFAAVWNASGLRFGAPVQGPWNLEIRNAMGTLVRSFHGQEPVSALTLSQREFPAGLYWLVLGNQAGRSTLKILRH